MRLGFACKYMCADQTLKKSQLAEIECAYRFRTITLKWLNSQLKSQAEARLWDILRHNTQSLYNLIYYVSTLPEELRMVRLGSDVFPLYTHPDWIYFWQQSEVQEYCSKKLIAAGDFAREKQIRLSMHPGQFTVLASEHDVTVEKSIQEFEYHVDIARWMGYGKTFQDFKINVHISGRRGPQGIKDVLPRLSPEARNCITIENDEMSWGLDASLELVKECALVLDIHHHWVATGEYIQPTDPRFLRIIDSWRGVRPVIHYSVSKETLLKDQNLDQLPDRESLFNSGMKKMHLRAHSDFLLNRACNKWALSFAPTADIMVESKMKNLATLELYEYWKNMAK
jgi:UV DNA damage endonuclease